MRGRVRRPGKRIRRKLPWSFALVTATLLAGSLSTGVPQAVAIQAAPAPAARDTLSPARGEPSARAGGTQLWATMTADGDTAHAVAVSPDGSRVYVTGCSGSSACGGHYLTVAYSASTGGVLWSAGYEGTQQGQDYASAIALNPDGTVVYVTGTSRGSYSDYGDYATIAYEAGTGTQLWVARFDQSTNDFPCCLKVSPDGSKVYVTGETWSGSSYFDFATLAYDATTGAQLWLSTYKGKGYDNPHSLGVSPDGARVFVTGESPGNVYNDYLTVAYDADTGAQSWLERFNSGGTRGDTPNDLAVDPGGARVYVTGCSGDFDYCVDSDYATVAYDSTTGSLLWVARYNDPIDGVDIGTSVAASPDGQFLYVTGSSDQQSSTDYVTIAYRATTGALVWKAVFGGPRFSADYPCCVVVSPAGDRLYVTGSSYQGEDENFSTVAYDSATGAQLWVARYNGSHNGIDDAHGLATSPDGTRVFVTGTSDIAGNYDYATVAYSAS